MDRTDWNDEGQAAPEHGCGAVRWCARSATRPSLALIAAMITTGALGWSATARATLVEPLSTRQLVSRATTVAEGTVVGQRVLRIDDQLWTESLIRVSHHHKPTVGGRAALLRVRQPGGEMGRQGLHVAGAATFRVGERVVVFVRPVGDYHVVVGMCLGKYTILRDRQGIERVRRDLSGASFVQLGRTGRPIVTPSVRVRGAPPPALGRLRAVIATIVAESASPEKGEPGGGGR